MQKLLTGGLGFTASEIVQQSNISDVSGAITQLVIAIVTLIGLFKKKKLNQTVKELEQLRSMFNSHVHSGVTTGPGSSGPTVTQVTKPFSQFQIDDYEDKSCIH